MKIPVQKKSYIKGIPADDYWDHALLNDVFAKRLWNPVNGYDFEIKVNPKKLEDGIIIIPARQHAGYEDQINKDIQDLDWCILMLTGDEENVFDITKIKHKECLVYQMTPHKGSKANRFLVNGYAPGAENLKPVQKNLNWFFAGQNTHKRRNEAVKAMKDCTIQGELIKTPGFTKGIALKDFYKKMLKAKIAPCPGGAVIPDTFRLYEALECGALPLVDAFAPQQKEKGYWEFLFGETPPFLIVEDWQDLTGIIQYFLDVYPERNNEVFAWWQNYKRNFVYQLNADIEQLSGYHGEENKQDITILMPTSPIERHPDTSTIEETIKSVRDRLPEAEIIIMFDGVREEQLNFKKRYEEYKQIVLNKCNYEWKNVLPVVFKKHHHQAAMTRYCLKKVKTGCIMFVEHDAPLCEDIPFKPMVDLISSQEANMVRLNHEALILPDHLHLTVDKTPQVRNDIEVTRTAQWSQRPHVASTSWYREIIDKYFSEHSRTMIEDRIHGFVAEAYQKRGLAGWQEWKLWLYTPKGDQKRSYHIDGRGNESKFDMKF